MIDEFSKLFYCKRSDYFINVLNVLQNALHYALLCLMFTNVFTPFVLFNSRIKDRNNSQLSTTIQQNEDSQEEKEESHLENKKSKQEIQPYSKYKTSTPVRVTEDQDERFYLLIQGNKR